MLTQENWTRSYFSKDNKYGTDMHKDDFFVKTQIESDLNRVITLMDSGIFTTESLQVFRESVFTEVMIKLHDLLQKLNKLSQRIVFTDDIEGGDDITDLVSKVRNAVCHMDSGEHLLDKERRIKFTFSIAYGRGCLVAIGNKKTTSDYADDICFFFGENKIYLKRHIVRCVKEISRMTRVLYGK